MRWDGLFDDLEAQVDALEQQERAAEIGERTRAEVGRLDLVGRLLAAQGRRVRVRAAGGLSVDGTVSRVGVDWLLLDEGARETLLATAHLLGVRGLPRYSAPPQSLGVVDSRFVLRHALRGIARDRSAVRLHLVDGSAVDATIDRVGANFVEVATHAPGELRRRQDVLDSELVPVAAIVTVRRLA